MVGRGAGAVGCAHCKVIGADSSCQVCTRLVCPRCAADWATCDEPSGRVVRLGLTARVRDIDPLGRLALVSHWRQPLRLFDLRALAWIPNVRWERTLHLIWRKAPPRLTAGGRLVHGEYHFDAERGAPIFSGIRMRRLDRDSGPLLASAGIEHGTAVTATKDIFYYVTDTQQVAVLQPDAKHAVATIVEPLPRKVIHSVYIDAERELLAAGSWSEVVLHRLVDGRLEKQSHLKTTIHGDVRWLAIGGPYIALAIQLFGAGVHVEVRRLERDQSIGDVVHEHTLPRLRTASMSRDGRYIALATDRGLLVQALDTGDTTVFDEHTDEINLVRFAGDDQVLISADTDHRVVMRPRTPKGYARPLISIAIPSTGVPLPEPPDPALTRG